MTEHKRFQGICDLKSNLSEHLGELGLPIPYYIWICFPSSVKGPLGSPNSYREPFRENSQRVVGGSKKESERGHRREEPPLPKGIVLGLILMIRLHANQNRCTNPF